MNSYKTSKFVKVFSLKVSRYTVSLSDVIVFLVSVIAVWHCHGFSSVFCSATYTYHNGLFYVSLYD